MADFRTAPPNIGPFIQQRGGGDPFGAVSQAAQGLFAMMLNQQSQAKARQFQVQQTAEARQYGEAQYQRRRGDELETAIAREERAGGRALAREERMVGRQTTVREDERQYQRETLTEQRSYGEELFQRRSQGDVETTIQREQRAVERQAAALEQQRAYEGQLIQFEVDTRTRVREIIAEVKAGKDSPIEQGTIQLWTKFSGGEKMDADQAMTMVGSQRGHIDPKTGKRTESGDVIYNMLTGDTPITYRSDDKEADLIERLAVELGPDIGENSFFARIAMTVMNDEMEDEFSELPTRAEAEEREYKRLNDSIKSSGSLAQKTVVGERADIFGYQEVAQGGPQTPVGLLKTANLDNAQAQDFLGLVGNPAEGIQGRLHTENYRITKKVWADIGLPELGKQGTPNAGFDLILDDAEIRLDPVFDEEGKVKRFEILVPPESRVDPSWIKYTEQQINKSAEMKAKVLGHWAQNGSGTAAGWLDIGRLVISPMSGPAAGQPDEMTDIGERKAKRDEDYFDSLLKRTKRDK